MAQLTFLVCLLAISGVLSSTPHNLCKDTDCNFPKRYASPGTSVDQSVPQYLLGQGASPYFEIGATSPVDPFGTGFTPLWPPNLVDPSSFTGAAVNQTQEAWTSAVRAFGSFSLKRDDLVHVQLQAFNLSNLPAGTPTLLQSEINMLGSILQARQMAIPPTLTDISVYPQLDGVAGILVNMGTFKYFDSKYAMSFGRKHGCLMDHHVAYQDDACRVMPSSGTFQFSQARTDWNDFHTSLMTAKTTSGASFSSQMTQITTCLNNLMTRGGVQLSSTLRVHVYLANSDLGTENTFRTMYKAWLASKSITVDVMPPRTLAKGYIFSDTNALIGMSVESFAGASGESVSYISMPNVFRVLDEYNHLAVTPGGRFFTSDIFGTKTIINGDNTPVTQTNGDNFLPVVLAALNRKATPPILGYLQSLRPSLPAGYIVGNWTAEQIQLYGNLQTVLGEAGISIEDAVFVYNNIGPSGRFIGFLGTHMGIAIVFNGTQGTKSPARLANRDDSFGVDLPFYAAGLPGSFDGTMYSAYFWGVDTFNNLEPAPRVGDIPGVSSFPTCDGTTDITSCPLNTQRQLGATVQPSHSPLATHANNDDFDVDNEPVQTQ
jgi:hypothetical protein